MIQEHQPAIHSNSRLVFEFPATGGVIPSQQFTTVRLIKYLNPWDYVLMGAEIIFGLFILYYAIEEALEMKTHKFNYFRNSWNWLDILVIGVINSGKNGPNQ